MSQSRFPAIEAVLGGRIDPDLSIESLERLRGSNEDDSLESKAGFWDVGEARECAKDVCALANAQVGVIFRNIRAEKGRAVTVEPFDAPDMEPAAFVQQALQAWARPYPACHPFVISDDQGRIAVVVLVPQSPDAPHAIRHNRGEDRLYSFPVRVGSETGWLSEAQIAARYRERFRAQADAQHRRGALASLRHPEYARSLRVAHIDRHACPRRLRHIPYARARRSGILACASVRAVEAGSTST